MNRAVGIAGLVLTSSLILAVAACAEQGPDIADGTVPAEDNSAVLPPPSNGSTSSTSSTSSSSSSSSSGSTSSTSSGSTTSSSGSTSGSGGAGACSWAGDFLKVLEKLQEIQAGAPCDSTCNPATHCCFDLLGGGGGSSGLPGLDAGGGSSGMPGTGACVSK